MTFVGDKLFVSSSEGLFWSTNLGATWTKINGLPNAPIGYIRMIAGNLFAAPTDGGLFVSADSGKTWEQALRNNFICPSSSPTTITAFGDNIPDTVFAVVLEKTTTHPVSQVWFSDNRGREGSWYQIFTVPYSSLNVLRDLAIIRNQLFTFSNTSEVFRADISVALDKWSELGSIPETKYVNSSLVYNSTTILVTCDNGIRVSDDLGVNWGSILSGLPRGETGSLIANNKHIFTTVHTAAGLFLGVYYRPNNQGLWKPIQIGTLSGTNTVENGSYIQAMIATNTHLFIGTYGDGVKVIQLKDVIPD